MDNYQYQAALERLQQLDEQAQEYGEHRMVQLWEVDLKSFREIIEHAQEIEHTNAQPLWQRVRELEEEHAQLVAHRRESLEVMTYQREVISKLAKENMEFLQAQEAAETMVDTLQSLIREYRALQKQLYKELYNNAGDSEEMEIAIHELNERASALLGEVKTND